LIDRLLLDLRRNAITPPLTGKNDRGLPAVQPEKDSNERTELKATLVPFQAWHAKHIDSNVSEAFKRMAPFYEAMHMKNGESYTALLGDHPMGAGGILILREGIGDAWMLLSPLIRSMPLFLSRTTRRMHKEIAARFDLRRIQMSVDARDEAAFKWAVFLGFQNETHLPMRNFQGRNHHAYLLAKVI
jgi:hypothetical protein